MDISGLLGDLYESAETAETPPSTEDSVTELPVPAEPPHDDEPATAPLPLAAEHRAAQLRAEEVASLATTSPTAAAPVEEPVVPTALVHEIDVDDLLPKKRARGAGLNFNISFAGARKGGAKR